MDTVESKIIANYWADKIKKNSKIDFGSFSPINSEVIEVPQSELAYYYKLTSGNELAEFTILITIFNTLVQRYFEECQLIYSQGIGVDRDISLLYAFDLIEDKAFKEILQNVKSEVQEVYKYRMYDNSSYKDDSLAAYTSFGFFFNKEITNVAKLPFSIHINTTNEGMKLQLVYSDKFIAKNVANHFLRNIKKWVCNLEVYLSLVSKSISLVFEEEKTVLLDEFNATTTVYDRTDTIISLFEKQVEKTPDAIAIICDNRSITYRMVDERANQIANYLKDDHGILAGDLVAVKLERTEKLIIALIAVLKVGAAYVPVDVNYPEERIAYIEKDSNSKLVIDEVVLSSFESISESYSKLKERIEINSFSLAYIIYTSGTTGNPKGVMITHANAVALIYWAQSEFDSSKFDIVFAGTSHCFDLSVYEMFYTLSIGKKIKVLSSGLDISDALPYYSNILLNTVPSTARKLLEEGHDLKNVTLINLAGEAFPVDIATKLQQTNIEVRNLYGPSEDTTYSTCYKISDKLYETSIPIGKPIDNTQAYILDESLALVPIGVTGKLYLSGLGITEGYLHKPELTAEKFIDNPYKKGELMYDTGDLSRWMLDGNIAFLGRKDHQVKLRGYRIELGEIEAAIQSFSEVVQQVVVVVRRHMNEEVLAAFFVTATIIDKALMREFLLSKLPSYMVPGFFVEMDQIPLTPNGKVNIKALPELSELSVIKESYVGPRNHTEISLVAIWEEILGVEKIGIKDHFFELGGHSLMISQLINKVHKTMGKRIPFKIFYTNPTIESLCNSLKNEEFVAIKKAPEMQSYPVTPSQHRLWLLSQMEGGNQAYQITTSLMLKGNLCTENFKEAFDHIINRHEVFRTFFEHDTDGILKQNIISKEVFDYRLSLKDLSKEEFPQDAARHYINSVCKSGLDIKKGQLFKANLLKITEDEHVFFMTLHHIISDGWSLEILNSEVIDAYQQKEKKGDIILQELSIQFKDYAVWLSDAMDSSQKQVEEEYWLSVFSDTLPILELPNYQSRPLVKTYTGDIIQYNFPKQLIKKLKNISQEHQATLFMTLMSTVKMLLSRYSNQNDIIVGTPIAGRAHPDLETQVGLYLNTLAIRSQLNNEDDFSTILANEKQQLLAAYAHQEYPFDQLIEKLNITRDTSRSPLFDVMVVLQNQQQLTTFQNNDSLSGFSVSDFEISRKVAQFDLSFTFVEHDTLSLLLSYNTDLYTASFVENIIKHLEKIFEQIINAPETKLEEIDFITLEEKQQIFSKFNATTIDYPLEKTVVTIFNEQVEKSPENIAIVFNEKSWTYADLNLEANNLASYLIESYQLSEGKLVAVHLERSAQLVISLLAILKTGAAYVPIDTNYPEERISYIIEDAKVCLTIDQDFITQYYSIEKKSKAIPGLNIKSSDLAYVIYTSGSTGKPKGVMITHKSLTNLCFWHQDAYGVTQESKGTLFSGIGFDASVWEIYPYLTAGASLYPIQLDAIRLDLQQLVSFLRIQEITHAYLPSRICQDFIIQGITNLNTTILTGGEALVYPKKSDLQIYNNYGPTENTVVTTYYDCKYQTKEQVPIGKPISNTQVYILSENLVLTPIGVIGELCISGDGLALGYLNRPDLTAEKFVENPYVSGKKLYRTGDLARWLPDGNIEFIERKDTQIKIRGHRIELGEIEYTIAQYTAEIVQVVVNVQEINNEKELVVYYVSNTSINPNELRAYIGTQLPSYMIPNYYIKLEQIPLTSNGKVAKEQLPEITEKELVKKEFIAPTNEVESKVVEIWKEILAKETIGITDNFFELGGHSLLLSKLTNTYHKVFEKEIDLKTIYTNLTPEYHAYLIMKNESRTYEEITKISLQDTYEISPSQMRFWLLYKIYGKSKEFNICSKFFLSEDLNLEFFETAFNTIVKRHEILRTIFLEVEGRPRQKIEAYSPIKIEIDELLSLDKIESRIYNYEFDLDQAPLYKMAIGKGTEGYTLFFNIHHSISDGLSLDIVVKEILVIYQALLTGEEAKLAEIEVHYKDYSYWQNQLLETGKLKSQKIYWEEKLAGDIPYLQLPKDYIQTVKNATTTSGYHTIFLNKETQEKIITLSKKTKTSVFSIFVASLKILLQRITSEKDIVIGIPAANRNHEQLKNMVGCFLNTIMLRDTVIGGFSFENFVKQVNQTVMEGLANQNYPFESILNDLQVTKTQSRFPISPVFLNMLDFNTETNEEIHDFSSQDGIINSTPKFELECYLKTYTNGIAINCVYNNQLLTQETIKYWIEAYVDILNQVLIMPTKLIDEIIVFESYLPSIVAPKPINEFTPFEAEEIQQSIISRFESQVEKHPNRTAVYSKNRAFTYTEVNNLANLLAKEIENNNQNGFQRVALLVNHDESSVIAMLAVLKTGKSYVPIDYTNPLSRIQFIVEDAKCNVIVCNSKTKMIALELEAYVPDIKVVVLNTEETKIRSNHLHDTQPSDEAYVLYTSGSTGKPKGVMQNNKNVLHYISVYTNNVQISEQDNLSVLSTYTFDASVKDIYAAILNGATVSFYDIMDQGLMGLATWLEDQKITILHMVPTIYRHFLKELAEDQKIESVRLIDLGGEACYKSDFELFKKYFSENALLVNDYGPTEATIISQKFLSQKSNPTRNNISLGNVVINTEVFILGEDDKQMRIYEEGEIVFKSEYLSLGYLNRPELTEKVFIESRELGGRIYKSGDIGRRLANGEIEFISRKDTQVKLNGLRIELAEIEYQLEKNPGIKEAIVSVKEVNNTKYLVAYVCKNRAITKEEIRINLIETLPVYMVPSIFVFMKTFPLTRTGKIDRKELPLPTLADLKTKKHVAPESEIEKTLAKIIAECLHLDIKEIGIDDSFFELGGNSLQAVIIVNRINQEFDTNLSIESMYNHLKIKHLSGVLAFSIQQNEMEIETEESDQFVI
ncbi:non-ribosomal peptide synthetase [Flavobacterium sp. '19STA2R22 D10 B1']|uniref:non-ribosomal peptide synthetase n=1 Tax=Flavobacterium aerium TaxID=3037261 RepID=UPI00278C0CF4|nr:non-ribosomal peptide synthetase [Flavobacterium sp. '19STA2R22 D10 B1']